MILHELDLGPDDAMLVFEERRQTAQADVGVFVDGETQDFSAVRRVPFPPIRITAEQAYPHRRFADDHLSFP